MLEVVELGGIVHCAAAVVDMKKPAFGDDQGREGIKFVRVWKAENFGEVSGGAEESVAGSRAVEATCRSEEPPLTCECGVSVDSMPEELCILERGLLWILDGVEAELD